MQQPSTNKFLPWIVCLSCGLFFFYEFIQMNMVNSLAPDLMREFHVTGNKLGLLAASYFDANLLFLLPAGIILDRFSTKKVALITMAICIIGTACFAGATSLASAAFFRFFTGIGSAFCFLTCMRLATIWFHDKRLALVTGAIMTLAFLGGSVAQTPMTLLIHHLGWRGAVYADAALGLVVFVIMFIFIKDYPDHQAELRAKRKQQLKEIGFWKSVRQSYFNWQNWLSAISANMTNLPVYILGAIWGSVYLVQTQGYSRLQASVITGMIFIGTLIGSPVVGWFSDKIRSRKLPIFLGSFFSLIIVCLIIYGPHLSYLALMTLFLLLGFVSSGGIVNYSLVAEKNIPTLTATSVSVVSFSVIGGGAFFQPVVGWLLDRGWDGTTVNHVPFYSAADYHHAFLVLPIAFVVSMLLVFFMKESHAKQKQF
jgi:MFS family permease